MLLTYCDHCKKRLGPDEAAVHLRTRDGSRNYDDPDRLSRALDLHRTCYIEHYQATIDQAMTVDTDTDPIDWLAGQD